MKATTKGRKTWLATIAGLVMIIASLGATASFAGAEGSGVPQHTLTVNVVGEGTVFSSPAGISSCYGSCTAVFDEGTTVTLEATPVLKAAFKNWTGACTDTVSVCKIVMSESKSVTATFGPKDNPGWEPPAKLKLKPGHITRNKRKGIALLPLRVSDAAAITLSGSNVKGRSATTDGATKIRLKVTATGRLAKKLARTGRVVAPLKVVGVPANGAPSVTKRFRVTLKKQETRH